MLFTGTISSLGEFLVVPDAANRTIQSFTSTDWEMVGGQFTVSDSVVVTRMRFCLLNSAGAEIRSGVDDSFGGANDIKMGIWDSNGTQLGVSSMHVLQGTMPFIYLQPGITYTVAGQIPPGYMRYLTSSVAQVASGPSSVIVPGSAVYSSGDTTFDMPLTFSAVGWPAGFKFHISYGVAVSQPEPPELLVSQGGQTFLLTLRSNFITGDFVEWELQYAKSADGAYFDDWVSIDTFPSSETTYEHGPLDPFDKPFYKYRYRVSSGREISSWSEETYAGHVVNTPFEDSGSPGVFDGSNIPQGTIPAGALNIDTLSALTANLGTVSAGLIRGPKIETSATNPRIALEQNVGFYAKDAAGNDTFRLDSTTGAATFAGTLTGSSFATGTTDPRVVMDSTGIYAKNAAHTDTFRIASATGSVTLTGAITTTAGSVVSGGHIVADSITATQIAASAITASELSTGAVTAVKIQANTITANEIAANAITATELSAGAVTASKLLVIAGGGNLQANSSFDNITTPLLGWSYPAIATAVVETTVIRSPGQSIKLTNIDTVANSPYLYNSTSRPAALEGKTYIGSAWFYSPTNTITGRISLYGYDNAGVNISSSTLATTIPPGVWTRIFSSPFTLPTGSVSIRTTVQAYLIAPNDYVYIDDTQIEEGDVPTSWGPKADEILPGTIVASMIQAGAITTTQLAADTIIANNIAANAIGTSELNANAVTAAKIAANTITAAQIASGTITGTQIAGSTIAGTNIASSTIATTNLVSTAIDGMTITGATVRTASGTGARVVMSTGGITGFDSTNTAVFDFSTATGNLTLKGTVQSGSSVPTSALTGTVSGSQIGTSTITETNVASGTLTSASIAAGSIVGGDITAGTITGGNIAAGTITASNILANTITAGQIASGTVTATELNATLTITGKTIRTGSTGARVEMDDAGFRAYNSGGTAIFNYATSTGTIAMTGSITLTNNIPATQISAGAIGAGVTLPATQLSSGAVPAGVTVPAAQLSSGTVPSGVTVPGGQVSTGISATNVTTGTLTGSLVGTGVSATNVTTGAMSVDRLTGASGGKITNTMIGINAIDTPQLNANAVTTSKILSGSITTDLLSFNVGSRNLMIDSSFEQNIVNEASYQLTVDTDITHTATMARSGSRSLVVTMMSAGDHQITSLTRPTTDPIWFTPVVGETYTVSLYSRPEASAPVTTPRVTGIRLTLTNDAGTTQSVWAPGVDSVETAGAWKRYIATFIWNPGVTTGIPSTATKFAVGAAWIATVSGEVHYIDDLKIERGGIATDWSPYINPTVIDGNTITGATIRTSASAPRVQMDTAGLEVYSSDGTIGTQITPANGIDIIASTSSRGFQYPGRRLGIIDSGSGALKGVLEGLVNSTLQTIVQLSSFGGTGTTASTRGTTSIQALGGPVSTRYASIDIQKQATDATTGLSFVQASVTNESSVNFTRTLIDQSGAASYIQLPSAITSQFLWGQVSSTGTISRDGSGNWTIIKSATGTYDITASIAVSTQAYIVTATVSAAGYCYVNATAGTGFTIKTFNTSNAATDIGFMFTAVGKP